MGGRHLTGGSCLDQACTREWVAAISGRQRAIARYLVSEVLERQSRPVQTFLLETSVLPRLSDGLCRALTGRSDSGRLLARLSRDNVFISSLDDKGEWYRYHHLFAELLNDELRRRDRSRLPELHRRAAAWSEEQGDLEGAVHHWLAAGEVAKAGEKTSSWSFPYSSQGWAETVRRWIELFTDEQIRSNVPLALTARWVALMTGDPGAVRRWTGPAMAVHAGDSPIPYGDGSERAFQASLRALAPDGVTAMREDAESAAQLAAACHPAWRAAIDVTLGAARWLSGDGSGAEKVLRQAIKDGYPLNTIAELAALGYSPFSWPTRDAGRRREQRQLEPGGDSMSPSSGVSRCHCLWSRLRKTVFSLIVGHRRRKMEWTRSRGAFRSAGWTAWMGLVMTVTVAQAALDRGDLSAAEHRTATGMATLRTWPDAGILRDRLERVRRAVQEQRLAGSLTPMEQRVLDLLATHLALTEIAGKLFVSPNTMKTHVSSLYRKLNVHSRTEAVERARELGFLKS